MEVHQLADFRNKKICVDKGTYKTTVSKWVAHIASASNDSLTCKIYEKRHLVKEGIE